MGGRGSGGGGGSRGGDRSASSAKMPTLSGSPKQVSWANDIRRNALASLDANVRNAEKNRSLGIKPDGLHPSVKSAKEVRSTVVKAFQSQTSAKSFIDSRGSFTQKAFNDAAIALDARMKRR